MIDHGCRCEVSVRIHIHTDCEHVVRPHNEAKAAAATIAYAIPKYPKIGLRALKIRLRKSVVATSFQLFEDG